MRKIFSLCLLAIFTLLIAACSMPASSGGSTPVGSTVPPTTESVLTTPEGEALVGLAAVDNIDVRILESFPVQIQVAARGNLPDGCTQIAQAIQERNGNAFRVTLTTTRPKDAICTEALVSFEQVISLDVIGLPAGAYGVDVNGVAGSFTLSIDNVPTTQEVETPDAGNSSIGGRVWHDECAVAGGENGAPEIPSAGCVALEGGGYQANGIFETDIEKGIGDIEVFLGSGPCPSNGLAAVTANEDGEFFFENLTAGDYCVSVAEEGLTNGPILLPGRWTAPEGDKAEQNISLEAGQEKRGVFFGWDFQNLPEPEAVQDETQCTNKLAFVDDVTLPDGSPVANGQPFEKTWKVRNDGTCTWNTTYALIFKDGEQMGAASPAGLAKSIEPGDTADLTVRFTAPTKAGLYRSNWMLKSAFGQEFGTGRRNDQPIWVEVTVIESLDSLGLGDPTYVEPFNDADRFFLVDSGNAFFEIDNGEMVLLSRQPGSFDEWGLADYPEVSDFYLEATIRTGETCAGKDRYGLLFRSPDPNQGYVFGFSCDGNYRIYGWDGSNYRGLVEWTSSALINSGPEKTNKIGVFAEGDTLKLFANGSLLVELTDRQFDEGSFGIYIAAGSSRNFTAYAEDLSLWDLEE